MSEKLGQLEVIDIPKIAGSLKDEWVNVDLSEVDDIKRESNQLYLDEQYQESLEKLEEAFEGLKRVADDSVKVKETALFWIYMIEWFTVTGTCVLTGFVLWTLMVRRRLYREVEVTRAR